ncbi:hypothetical protein BHM03_00041451 [Ensete ventricosum]|nr:hypothetical protein BHM03_00041451 [Ensete ventricosum]
MDGWMDCHCSAPEVRVGYCWRLPVCASSPAVVSVGWMVPRSSAQEVGCWNGGARVGLKYSSSGRVGSRRDPSDGQVSSVVDFYDPFVPLRCKSLYSGRCRSFVPGNLVALVAYPVVLAVRDASTDRGIDLTRVRSAVRPLGY